MKPMIDLARKAILTSCLFGASSTLPAFAQQRLTPLESLGKQIFFDDISNPATQSCSSCHDPRTGWTTPRNDTAVMPGAVAERFGNRKPPSNAYIVFSPVRDIDTRTGGALWDARADGTVVAALGLSGVDPALLGPAADQSTLPFTNPLEHNTTPQAVCEHVAAAGYAGLYEQAWGKAVDCAGGLEESFARIGLSIVAYEASREVSPFASRFDAGALSPLERRGFDLFTRESSCSGCHTIEDGAQPGDGSNQLLTNFRTFNIGTPRNPANPFYRMDTVTDDDGNIINPLGEAVADVGDGTGRVKVPTLRNVGKQPSDRFVKRYMHNGFFNSLESVVHFYNTRDIKPVCPDGFDIDAALAADCWPAPENAENLAGEGTDEIGMGNLGFSSEDERAVVAFLRTLDDNVAVAPPRRSQRTFPQRETHGNSQGRGNSDRPALGSPRQQDFRSRSGATSRGEDARRNRRGR